MSDAASDDADLGIDMFAEPAGFYQTEKPPTYVTHRMLDGRELRDLRLVGSNPLWGHLLWNAGRTVSDYLEQHPQLVRGKTVLELGAGVGLPGLVCAVVGAAKVLITDYPDADLIDNLKENVLRVGAQHPLVSGHAAAEGHLWGAPVAPLLAHIDNSTSPDDRFDVLILADLLFNHSEHEKLLATICATLSRESSAQALVFFTPYRPWLLEKDLAFFELAAQKGVRVEKILEKVMDKVMFEEDPGDELLRRTVFGYSLRMPESNDTS